MLVHALAPHTQYVLSFTDSSTTSLTTSQMKYRVEHGAPCCYHMSSLNENKAKQFCKKQPNDVIAYPLSTLLHFVALSSHV